MKCGEAITRLLRAYGVDTVFGIPGVHTLELYRGLEESGMRHVLVRHEQGAGFMADGYARISGHPGVCYLITGPGVTNATTAIGQAYSDSIPMLVVSSTIASHALGKGLGRIHEISDQQAVTAPLTAFSATARTADEVPELIAKAFATFAAGRPRPVHISVPTDVLAQEVDRPWSAVPPPARPRPDRERIAAAARLLGSADRPAIVVGGGAIAAGPQIKRIAELVGAGVLTTFAAKGAIDEADAASLGATPDLAATQEWLAAADVVLAIGTELAEPDTMRERIPIPGRMIRVDIDPAKLDDQYPPEIGIVADAAMSAAALLEALQKLPIRNRQPASQEALASIRARNAVAPDALARQHHRALAAIRRVLPADGVIASDMTQLAYTGNNAFVCSQPRTWLHPVGFGTLGYALPAAIGAKLAAPERAAVAIVGDMGFLYCVQELATAVELQLPIIVILWNNDGLGAIRRRFDQYGIRSTSGDMKNPDFQALARSFGCMAARPESIADLEATLAAGLQATVPTLIELRQDAGYLASSTH
jgi:5-guanidino-2-oxopentanoate decarboxylase